MQLYFPRQVRPTEIIPLGLDFEEDLRAGDQVANVVVTAAAADGTDVTATVLQDPGISGTAAYATFKGGVDGDTYTMTFTVTTSQGFKFQHDLLVIVREHA